MNIRLYIAVREPIEHSKFNLVYELSNSLKLYFLNKEYGGDVKNVEIGLLMVFTREGYEDWHKPKRMTYTNYKKSKHKLTGEIIVIEKTLKYEIKFSDTQLANYVGNSDNLSKVILADEIVNSVSNYDKLPRQIKDFDVERFKTDLHGFFKVSK